MARLTILQKEIIKKIKENNLLWNDLTEYERDTFINQNTLKKDHRLVYVSPKTLLFAEVNSIGMWENCALGQSDWEVCLQASLTGRQKECLYKSAWEGQTQAEIAHDLGIPQQTVHYHITRAKVKIKSHIKKMIDNAKCSTSSN